MKEGGGVVAGIQRSARRASDGKPGRAAGRGCENSSLHSGPVLPTTVPACSTHYSPCLFHPLQSLPVPPTIVHPLQSLPVPPATSPKGGRGCLMSPSCLESQGCHLIPLSYLLSCFFPCLALLLFLSCHFSANGLFS